MHEEKRSWLLAGTWLVVVVLLCYLVPHQQIAGKLRAVWGVTAWQTLVAHLVVLAAWYGAYFIHIRLGPEEDEPTPLWKPVAQGVIWAVATGLTIELCLAWFLAGKPNSFALFLSGLVTGKEEPRATLVFLVIGLLAAGLLLGSRNVRTILSKELRSFYTTPIAYVVTIIFTSITAFFFNIHFQRFQDFLLRMRFRRQMAAGINLNDHVLVWTLSTVGIILLFMVPIVTMRLLAEEKKSKSFELLMTTPIRTAEIIAGKYMAAMVMLSVMLGLTLLGPVLLNTMQPGCIEWGPVVTGYLGLFLLVAAFAAIGIASSSFTENQIVAAMVTFGILLVLWVIEGAAMSIPNEKVKGVVSYLSILSHLRGFVKGVIEVKDVAYYLSVVFLGTFLAHRIVESQRWR